MPDRDCSVAWQREQEEQDTEPGMGDGTEAASSGGVCIALFYQCVYCQGDSLLYQLGSGGRAGICLYDEWWDSLGL